MSGDGHQDHAGFGSFADVEPRETELLITSPPVPKGDVTLVYGEGSVGKGRLVCSWVAQVINADPTALVVMVLPEDNASEQVVMRLQEAGVTDLTRVINMTRLPGGDRFKLSASAREPGHIGLFRAFAEQVRDSGRHVAMLVIDPLAACVGWGSIQTNQGARRCLEGIQDACADFGIACTVVAHAVKSGALQGSAGLQQAARHVYQVAPDPNNPRVRLVTAAKANNLPDTEPVRFVIEDSGSGPRVVMLDAAEITRRQESWRAPVSEGAGTAILDTLRSALVPLTLAQVAQLSGVAVGSCRTLLWRMTRRGQVTMTNGCYSTVQHRDQREHVMGA